MNSTSDPVPSKLGKYVIRRELGRGAMGVVYEGFDPLIERVVAIKTIRPERLDEAAADMLARFRREAQAAGRLNHPGIVSIYEYGEENGVAFIAMEFVKGKELKSYFDEGQRFAEKDIARIMGEILAALEHAHQTGVTHRDMKPANVILLEGGTVKVADFGLARIETSDLTQAGTILGTPTHMSPEQFLGTPADARSDIFSCGVILYQFLTGERPFTGAATTIMRKVLGEEPLAPSHLNTLLAPGWDAVVRRAMAKKPADRYQTTALFAADIRAVAEGRAPAAAADSAGLAAEATVLGEAALRAASQTKSGPAIEAPPAQKAPSKKPGATVVAAAAAVLLASVGGGAYLLWQKRADVSAPVAGQSAGSSAPAVATAPAEPGVMAISAVGFADPAKFNGDAAAAGAEARADARRQLVEKALAIYVSGESLDRNYQWLYDNFLPRSGEFIKTTLSESGPLLGKDGLVSATARATIRVRDVQKSLNQMSEKERIQFIRNNGDPKISVQMLISNADTAQALPAGRSLLAENVIKERIKSFGFRAWSIEGETATGPGAKPADFHVVGEVKLRQLSARLAASGLTITKTALTSWTLKAIDKATGEEIYSSTTLPKSTSWPTEDAALAEIGRLVGDEFSKNFFLEHFNFGSQKISLVFDGLPGAATSKALLRELRSLREVLDVQSAGDNGFLLELPEGSAADLVSEDVLKPLNAKLGRACFALSAASGTTVTVSLGAACASEAAARMETAPPAGLLSAPPARSRSVLKT